MPRLTPPVDSSDWLGQRGLTRADRDASRRARAEIDKVVEQKRAHKEARERRSQELREAYEQHERLGGRRWQMELDLPPKCAVCGDAGMFLVRAKASVPDRGKYHVVPNLRPDMHAYWLCVCDCSWDEVQGKVGPQTAAGLAKVKALFAKQIPF